ncbi:tellurite resistance TerB family protein [Pseudomonas sp. GOM6]|uniref:tellurite resistance TerB family protein n=1 Tax=unclassified Pseudomonas TaxID=196821 RepID=UPI002409840C|nr:tellurite resistance TerB family protein [Pseudomonas sp. GOM6]MDG1581487.1 tellurite resistance TerB family protein [Pseudomonas sp. GOM6]
MNTRGLLDQLLKSGQDLLQQKQGGSASSPGLGGLLGGVTGGKGGGDLSSLLKGAGGGALAAGALGLLLGNKSARKLGGKALTYGGLAALGVIAYKAYGNWQAQQGVAQAKIEPQTVDRLPAPQAELHSQAILKAMVAAAKADGHVDAKERQLIEEQIGALANDPELLRWLDAELNKPLDPADVARAASTPEMAAEMYIASVLMVDEEHFMERAYLEELARQLKLEPGLKAELEAQVRRELA